MRTPDMAQLRSAVMNSALARRTAGVALPVAVSLGISGEPAMANTGESVVPPGNTAALSGALAVGEAADSPFGHGAMVEHGALNPVGEAAADTPADNHEVAEQQECTANGVTLPAITNPPGTPQGHLRGKDSITLHYYVPQVMDSSRSTEACEQRGARSSFARAMTENIHGRWVSDTADEGGWVTLASETNAEVDDDFTIHLKHPVEPLKLPDGSRTHCVPGVSIQTKSKDHYGAMTGSDSNAGLLGPGTPGLPAEGYYIDHYKVCTPEQLQHALKRAKAAQRRHRQQQQGHHAASAQRHHSHRPRR